MFFLWTSSIFKSFNCLQLPQGSHFYNNQAVRILTNYFRRYPGMRPPNLANYVYLRVSLLTQLISRSSAFILYEHQFEFE